MQQPSVPGVDHHDIHPSELCHLRGVAEALNDIVYGLLVKLAVILAEMPRTGARSPDGPVVVFRVCARARMYQLYRRKGVVLFYRVRRRVEIGEYLRVVQRDAELV